MEREASCSVSVLHFSCLSEVRGTYLPPLGFDNLMGSAGGASGSASTMLLGIAAEGFFIAPVIVLTEWWDEVVMLALPAAWNTLVGIAEDRSH